MLTKYQARKLREYEQILEVTALHPKLVNELAENDPDLVIPALNSMKDQIVRSEVIYEYTMIDMELDYVLDRHFFGAGKKLIQARRTKRFKTYNLMLRNIYIMQKLAIVRTFKSVPKAIVSNVAAINDLRNGLAHTFNIAELKAAKRSYKGHDIFKKDGLSIFRNDAEEIRYFFMPFLKKIIELDENS